MKTKTYNLNSSPMIHAPGVIRYAQNLYRSGNKRDRGVAVRIVSAWNLPKEAVEAVLQGRPGVKFDETAETVTVTI